MKGSNPESERVGFREHALETLRFASGRSEVDEGIVQRVLLFSELNPSVDRSTMGAQHSLEAPDSALR